MGRSPLVCLALIIVTLADRQRLIPVFRQNPFHSVRETEREREREREREVLITKSNIRRNDFRASAEQQQGAAPAPPMKAPSSPLLSPCITCAINKLFTDVLKATEIELPAFRHSTRRDRQFIIISLSLARSARRFLPRDFRKETDGSEELKSVRPMKWCLSRFGFRLISVPAPPQKLRSRGAAEQFSLAIINDFIMIRPTDMFPLQGFEANHTMIPRFLEWLRTFEVCLSK